MPERITIQIGGMHCAMCASAIEKALSALPGMIEVRVNLSTEKASLIMDSFHCNLKSSFY
jgi:Cu+-exporting ATPase